MSYGKILIKIVANLTLGNQRSLIISKRKEELLIITGLLS